MHTKLMIPQSALTVEGLATVWTKVTLGMQRTPVLNKILEMQELLFTLVALVPFMSPHVPLQSGFLHRLITLRTPDHGGRIVVCPSMLLKFQSFPESLPTNLAGELFMAQGMLR